MANGMSQGVGRIGIADLIPGLGSWIQETRQGIEQPFRDAAEQRALGLLGTPGEVMNAYGPGQAPGGPAQFGVGDVQTQAPTGLMADPNDFFNQMKYATGLMATPYYQQAGQQFAGQYLNNMLSQPQREQQQQNWLMDQQRQQREATMKLGREQEQQIFERSNTLRDDFNKEVNPYRQALETYQNVQSIFANRGPENMTTTDDTALIKAYAKILLPNEAVMQDDVAQIAASDSISSVFRGFASRINAKMELLPEERREIYQAINELSANQLKGYNQLRRDYQNRAMRANVLPQDVLRSQMQVDQTVYGQKAKTPLPTVTPELQARIDAKLKEQEGPPNMFERAWDYFTDPLVEGWGDLRR